MAVICGIGVLQISVSVILCWHLKFSMKRHTLGGPPFCIGVYVTSDTYIAKPLVS